MTIQALKNVHIFYNTSTMIERKIELEFFQHLYFVFKKITHRIPIHIISLHYQDRKNRVFLQMI